ncbi:MAG TPA: M13 family metallopeptidase [Vicinamibacterales bacterium]|nr:M13 family metallopeptidase [Vicinamibacterales bacterium]
MHHYMLALVSVLLTLTAVLVAAQSSSPIPPPVRTIAPAAGGIEISSLDRSVDACTDFYQFACGGWMTANPMPPDQQRWGRFAAIQERNFTILREILEAGKGSEDEARASDFYAACMNEGGIEARGLAPLEADLARIAGLIRKEDLPALLAHLHGVGVNALFQFSSQTDRRDATQQIARVDQGGLGLPDRDYYLKTDARSLELKQKYVDHVQKMLELTRTSQDPSAAARAVLRIETALAEASLDRTTRRDPAATDHMMTTDEWRTLTRPIDWSAYVAATGSPAFSRFNIAVPGFFKALSTLLESTPVTELKAYFTWQLVNASAQLLPRTIADADFDFFNRTLGGQQQPLPRWQRCVTQTDSSLGEALGKAFVERAFGAAAKADTLAMVEGIKAAMEKDIAEAPWMSDETKRAARAKLETVVDRIGYPDNWRDYSSVRVTRDDALGNRQRAIAFERQRTLNKIGQSVDRNEWSMTPPTVNAYYSPDRNTINFPAGILQPPFYQAGRDPAVNYGGAGAVVGHELTHGFDDQGRKFDERGNLRNWWTEADAAAYESRASCIADQYSQYVVAGDTNLNGRLTLGENTADNGGVRLALMAYLAGPGASAPVVDGFTLDQRFFIGFAQVWCENRRPEFERLRAATDTHSSGKYRVNGTVSNMPEFQRAFGCQPGAPMVRQNQCRVW